MTPRSGGAITALMIASLTLGTAAPTLAAASGWSDTHASGRVSVPADRASIKVCDGKVDNVAYKAVWHNDNPIDARDPFEVRAPQGGCATDSSLLGSIKVFKLCHGQLGANKGVTWNGCKAAVWPGGR
jgi:hypothetical protein